MSRPRTAQVIASPLIATLTFQESRCNSNHLALRGEFKSTAPVELPDIGPIDTIQNACRRAGTYLTEFSHKVAEASRGEARLCQLSDAFNYLFDSGCQLGLRLTGGDVGDFRRLQQAFNKSWPGWSRLSRKEIPKVQLVGPDEATAFPLELVPIFAFGPIPPLANASVLAEVASRFLGFTAVVCRVVPDTDRNTEVLHNTPALPVQFMRYLDPKKHSRLSRHSATTGFAQEAEFLSSLRKRKLVSLDGPWPTAAVPADKVAGRLVDALYDPVETLCPGSVTGPIQLAHIACHCTTDGRPDDSYELMLSTEMGDPRPVQLHEIRVGYVQRTETPPEPSTRAPVILNACGTSTVDPWSALSFQCHFLRNRHRAFIGTQAAIDDTAAANYAECLYRFLLGGYTLGESVVLARRQLLADTGSPLGLLYVQYGNDQFAVEQSYEEELPIGG
jgi:hypothetical protein